MLCVSCCVVMAALSPCPLLNPPTTCLLPAGTIRRLYLQHLIANTPDDKLRVALESLATPEVRKRIQLDINYLLDHPDQIVPYFTSRDADEVLLLVGSVLRGERIDPFNLTPSQQNKIKQALEDNTVDNWQARKYKKTKADREEVGGAAVGSKFLGIHVNQSMPLSGDERTTMCVLDDATTPLHAGAPPHWAAHCPPTPHMEMKHNAFPLGLSCVYVLSYTQLMKETPPAQLPPQEALTAEQMQAYVGPFPKVATGNGTIKVSSPPQTLSEMIKSVQHCNPKSGVKAPPQFGRLRGFKPMRIPIVFHCKCCFCWRGQDQGHTCACVHVVAGCTHLNTACRQMWCHVVSRCCGKRPWPGPPGTTDSNQTAMGLKA